MSDIFELVRRSASAVEHERQLPQELVERLRAHGFFHMTFPEHAHGEGRSPAEAFEAIRAISRADASVGWCVAQANAAGLLSGRLPNDVANKLFAGRKILAGVLAPRGAAKVLDGGMLLSGRWPFASGCMHAEVLGLGVVLSDGGQIRRLPDGLPDVHIALVDRADVGIENTWRALGLAGTGSHDVTLHRKQVTSERMISLRSASDAREPWFRAPLMMMFPTLFAAVAAGIADQAIEDIRALHREKRDGSGLSESGTQKLARSWARVMLTSAGLRALIDTITCAERFSHEDRVLLRASVVETVEASREAVDVAFRILGASAVLDGSVAQKRLRDALTLGQHRMLSDSNYESMAESWLRGTEPPPDI